MYDGLTPCFSQIERLCVHREHPLALVAVRELLSLGMRGTDVMSVVMTAVPQFSTCEWSVSASHLLPFDLITPCADSPTKTVKVYNLFSV